jgi:hypothetical protein
MVGQALFGCLTLTLSPSRLSPDLKPTMARSWPQKLKLPGKPKLTGGHGLRFQLRPAEADQIRTENRSKAVSVCSNNSTSRR